MRAPMTFNRRREWRPVASLGESLVRALPLVVFLAVASLADAAAAPAARRVIEGKARFAPPEAEAFPEMRAIWDAPATGASDSGVDHDATVFKTAERNGRKAAEAFFRARRYLHGWLAVADPVSGLIPRNLFQSSDFWNAPDSAADNYPFMVLAALLTDPPLMQRKMEPMLQAETRLTSRVGRLPDDYSFSKRGFAREKVAMERLIFGASEYAKDGLMPLTEWMGPSPWRDRMIGLVEDIWAHPEWPTPFGRIPSESPEVNGNLLQLLSRIRWLTGDDRFLDWGIRLGDYYLLGDHHPTRDFRELKLRDHGCEVVGGLSELYLAVHHLRPEKKAAYRKAMHEMLDGILARGRNEDGLLYDSFQPKTGDHSSRLADTWGYTYNAFLTVYLLDGDARYREAVRRVLASLPRYADFDWESGSADGIADAVEGALNLYNREPVAEVVDWIDHEMRNLWAKQYADGVIEGWHGDGNFTRTTLMYALWKTQGVTVDSWRSDLQVGATREGGQLHLSVSTGQAWTGRLRFDRPRHREYLQLPIDYPRINQFPEWFVAERGRSYVVRDRVRDTKTHLRGERLWEGIELRLPAGGVARLTVTPE